MNVATKQLAIFIRDLLTIPEATIKIGRQNFIRDDFNVLQIVVDTLGQSIPLTRAEEFDGELEETEYSQQWQSPCTVDFYGDDAYNMATDLLLLMQSQRGYELQRDNGITVYESSSLTDVKALTGEQYSERYQLGLNVQYTLSKTIATLRIDTAEINIINEV